MWQIKAKKEENYNISSILKYKHLLINRALFPQNIFISAFICLC